MKEEQENIHRIYERVPQQLGMIIHAGSWGGWYTSSELAGMSGAAPRTAQAWIKRLVNVGVMARQSAHPMLYQTTHEFDAIRYCDKIFRGNRWASIEPPIPRLRKFSRSG